MPKEGWIGYAGHLRWQLVWTCGFCCQALRAERYNSSAERLSGPHPAERHNQR